MRILGSFHSRSRGTFLSHSSVRAVGGVLALMGVLALAQGRGKSDPNVSSDKDTRAYDKHDFNGIWARNPQTNQLPPCPECRDQVSPPGYGFFGDIPPRTPAGTKEVRF